MRSAIVVSTLFLGFCICSSTSPPYEIAAGKLTEYPLPDLPYDVDALEPFIDGATVRAHYNGHHETYRKKMNNFLRQWRLASGDSLLPHQDLFSILAAIDQVPASLKEGITNNVGGFVNHAFYWSILSPNKNKDRREPGTNLMKNIERSFGIFQNFQQIFSSQALNLFGSGYVWLVYDEGSSELFVVTSKNQDCPLSRGFYPLLVIDMWEHSYYLKHQFRRKEYVDDFWTLVDWNNVEKLHQFWKARSALREREDL